MSFFKTNDPVVLEAIKQYIDDVTQLHEQCNSFGAMFSADKTIMHSTYACRWFGGLVFIPSKDSKFWTKPDRKDRTQRPRNKVSGMTEEEKESHAKLLEQWQSYYPKKRPSKDDFYKTIGTDWGHVLFSGFGFFVHKDSVYIETSLTLGPNVTEILGSEYKAAKAAFGLENNHVQTTTQ